jgi:predicted secreted Zn-dependent protease
MRFNIKVLGAIVGFGLILAFSVGYTLFLSQGEPQEIEVRVPLDLTYGDPPAVIVAEASSGLPVELEVKEGPCSLTNEGITTQGAGTCRLLASQSGDEKFRKASKEFQIEVGPDSQVVAFEELPGRALGEGPFRLTASSDSGLPISYSASGPCNVREGQVTLASPGFCTVTAAQAGNNDFRPAPSVSQRFRIYNIIVDMKVKTEFYAVTGATTELIFESIERNGPRVDGAPAYGSIAGKPEATWELAQAGGGLCEIGSMTFTFDLTITLPEHQQLASLTPQLRTKWQSFVDAVKKHEDRHAEIYSAGVPRLQEAMVSIPAQPCGVMGADVQRTWLFQRELLNQEQDQFHAEDNARLETLRAPTKAQLDANEARLKSLEAEINNLDAEQNRIGAELSRIESRLPSLESEILSLERSYPAGAPSDVVRRYESLIAEYNGLVERHRGLAASGNALIGRRNSLVDEYNRLVAARGSIFEQYAWLH